MPVDPSIRDHKAWLGYLQPDGLVVSPAALVDAGVVLDRAVFSLLQQQFVALVEEIPQGDNRIPAVPNLKKLLCEFLDWPDDCLYGISPDRPIPESLKIPLREFGETLEPTIAFKQPQPDDPQRPWLLLVQQLEPGIDLDAPVESKLAGWAASPTRRFERLMREAEVPIGLLSNATHLRLIYAPRGENSGTLTFPVAAMTEIAGRPILAAFHLLLSRYRLLAAPAEARLPALLKRSRDYQARVSTALAGQVLDALYELLRGFQAADDETHGLLLEEVLASDPDQVYGGLLSVLMRLVFLLYAEDRGLMPGSDLYVRNYAVHGLFERLRADAEQYPDTMEHRYGAWAQLLALFRAVHRGCQHPLLKMPAREGHLFDPDRYPFLEGRTRPPHPSPAGGRGDGGEGGRPLRLPLVPDGTVFRILEKLLVLDGERLSYRTLDVEQIGSVYETMMGFRLERTRGTTIALKPAKPHGAPVPINLQELLATEKANRPKFIADRTDYKLPPTLAEAVKAAESIDDALAALERRIARNATPQPLIAGKMVLVPTDERRKSGSHYTPRSLTEPIVRTTLEPVLRGLVAGRQSGIGSGRYGEDRVIPGSPRVAVGHGAGQGVLLAHEGISEGGVVRADQSDTQSGRIDSGQHRRGERPGEHGRVCPIPADRPGKSQGTGNAPDSLQRSRPLPDGSDAAAAATNRRSRADAASADPLSRIQTPPITPDSRFPTADSLVPTPEQILNLKVCDPAMGSGAFLVEACRQLADALVLAWATHGYKPYIPPDEDEVLHARRLIAQRCLYGVDRNPMAVDLAKLSLWLATLAKDHPFTFLDHSLRAGDSLVGLTRRQIVGFDLEPSARIGFVEGKVRERMNAATAVRRTILDAGDDMLPSMKRQKLQLADEALDLVRLAGDAVVSAFFAGSRARERKEKRDELFHLLDLWLQHADAEARRKLGEAVRNLREGGDGQQPVTPFHWEIEFPEVFDRKPDGFDAIVGNPPFAGKNTVAAGNAAGYPDWLQQIHAESHGNADLVAHFYRRAFDLIRNAGTFGLIATNTIAQGDTRASGLRWICKHGGEIYAVRKRLKWPGQAAVVVSVVHVAKGPVAGPRRLDDREVERITAFLFHQGGHDDPVRLAANAGKSFQGSIVLGMGFTFDDTDSSGVATPLAEMRRLIEQNPANREVIFPYIGGEEVNTSPTHAHHRYVINFGERSEEECRARWTDLMAIVEAKVKRERAKLTKNAIGRKRAKYWWHYGSLAKELYAAIAGLDRVLVTPQTSNVQAFAFLPTRMVYAHTLLVFPLNSYSAFCVLQSRAHQRWAAFLGPTMKDDLRYTPSDCFETFPFPEGWETHPALEAAGRAYYEFRADLMVKNNEGLTKTYNRFHDPAETSPDILRLRELHDAMDRAVLDAYGWTDIRPSCAFLLDYEDEDEEEEGSGESGSGNRSRRRKPWRYRWPDEIRDEVLARLLDLNAQRAAEERRRGAAAAAAEKAKTTATRRRAGRKRTNDQTPELFE